MPCSLMTVIREHSWRFAELNCLNCEIEGVSRRYSKIEDVLGSLAGETIDVKGCVWCLPRY